MRFLLALTLEGIPPYGSRPNLTVGIAEGKVEEYLLPVKYRDLMDEHFVYECEVTRNSTLDFGDTEYYDFHQCEQMSFWLEKRLSRKNLNKDLRKIFSLLKTLTDKAVELKTGIEIEI